MPKKYYEINLDSRRETTFEEDESMGIYSGVMGALISDCSPLMREQYLKRVLTKPKNYRTIRLITPKHSSES